MRPNLLTLNPKTGQNYTPAELAGIDLERRYAGMGNTPFGAFQSVTTGGIREIVPDATNDFFEYSNTGFIIGNDNEETRAQLQPWYEQLGNGFVKMGGLAATTFLDGTVGLLAGLTNSAIDVGTQGDQGAYNAFINNPFSNWMVDLQEQMERALPNYRTREEEENAFYENMLSGMGAANFWGDTVLKNAGFAIGALGAGYLTAGVGAELVGLNRLMKTSRLLEGLTLAAKEGKVLSQAEVAAAKTLTAEGLASSRAADAVGELEKVSRLIKAKTAQNQLTASFIGSVGEARIEALHNSREFEKMRIQEYDAALENGVITQGEYDDKVKNLNKELLNYQNSLFTANVALLSVSNYAQFRNVFAKGFTPNKVARNAITEIEKDGMTLYEMASRNKLQKTMDYVKLLKNPLAEMTEEQGQYAIQKASDTYYSMKLDNEANATVKNMMFSVGQGLKEAYGSEQGWESGFVGMLIGGVGVPTIRKKESGKYGLSLAGGIREDFKEQKLARQRLEMGVETANALIKDSMMQKLYDSSVVDVALEKKFNQAVQENDRMNGNLISAMQLANMVDAFTQIGRYDDFVTRLQDENNLSAVELRQKYRTKAKSPITGKEQDIDFFQNMTDDQVKEYIRNKSETAIARAEKIKKIRENIDIRFSNHSEDARKDLLLKSAAIVDMDERISKLLDELKIETSNNFHRGLENLKKNLTPQEFQSTLMNIGVSDFSDFATPVDLEQFLKKQNGLENYERLIKEYVEYQSDVEKKINFTEKARDLYGLIAKRQAFNDTYFNMSDPEYAANQDAANESFRNQRDLAQRASSERRARLYNENTSDDPEFGFDSTEFEVITGRNEINTVRGVKTKQDGTKEEMPPIQFTRKDEEVRESKTGDKYQTYYYLDENGKERKIDIANPVEDSRQEDAVSRLKYAKGDADNLYDQDGNKYSLDDLVQDPTFMKSRAVSIGEQRQQIINGVRQQTLKQLFDNNAKLMENISTQIKTTQEAIDQAKALLARARANKSGKTRVKINGKTTVYTIFGLEADLANLEKGLEDLFKQRKDISDSSQEILFKMRQAEAKGFTRGQFAEDIAAIEKQNADVQKSLDLATEKAKKLRSLIQRLKNLVGVVYPKFKAMYRKVHGMDPSQEDYDFVKNNLKTFGILWWSKNMNTELSKLKAEETARYENITAREEELAAVEQEIAELQNMLKMSNQMIEEIKKDQQFFEEGLAKVLAARRASQTPAAKNAEAASKKAANPKSKGIDEEVTAEEEVKRQKFSLKGLMKSIMNIFSTTGRHINADGSLTKVTSQQRWYRTAKKVKLDDGEYTLRVATIDNPGNDELFKDLPDGVDKEEAIAVILYRNGQPVGEDLQPVALTDVNRLVYTWIPLPTLETAEFGERYFDADPASAETQDQISKYTAFREELKARAKDPAKKGTFLRINGKSLGVLNTTPNNRKNPNNDNTSAAFDVLFQGTDKEKFEQYNASQVVVAKATTPEEQAAGIAYITVGGKQVQVVNGLPYMVTHEGNVIPMLTRKVTTDEAETIFDLLMAAVDSKTIVTSEGLEAEAAKPEEKEEKEKKTFVALRIQDSKKIKAAQRKGKYKGAIYNKKLKKWGYYAKKTKAKKVHGADVNSIDIFNYIGRIIRFGKQTKAEDSALTARPNPQTEIYVEGGKLYFFDFNKNEVVNIPFTKEALKENEEVLMKFIENKYHQVSSDLLNKNEKNGEFVAINEVLYDEDGDPYVDVTRYINYKSYLLTNKAGTQSGRERAVSDIPLTTNVKEDSETDPQVRSIYFTFSPEILDSPTGLKKDKPLTPVVTSEKTVKLQGLLKEVESALTSKSFDPDVAAGINTNLGGVLTDLAQQFEALPDEDINAITDQALKETLSEAQQEGYYVLLGLKIIIENNLSASSAAEAPVVEEEGEGTTMSLDQLNGLISSEEKTEEEEEEFPGFEEDEDNDESAPFRTQETGGSVINIEKARETLNRLLPQVPVKTREKLIDGIAQGKVDINGVLHLSELAEEGSEYHEALHSVMLGILTDEELAEVYTEARRLYGTPSKEQLDEIRKTYPKASEKALQIIWLDEQLAEDFRTYALSDGKITPSKKMKGFFERIWDSVKAILGLVETNAIDNMFAKLYTGGYANAKYDALKVKERIKTRNRYSVLPFTKDPVKDQALTKELVDGAVYFIFRDLLASNNTINSLSKITGRQFDKFVESALDQVTTAVLNADKTNDPEILANRESLLEKLRETPKARETIKNTVKDFIQRSLGVDLNIDFVELEEQKELSGNEDQVAETNKAGNDTIGNKDATTISPRDGTKAFVKLMIASLPETEVVNGVSRRIVTPTYGVSKLVDPNKAFNNILKYLHSIPTLDGMIAKLKSLEKTFPYMGDIATQLEDALDKGTLESTQMAVNFQQAMYKANINYKTWLVNEFDVTDTDPNSERQEIRIIENWKQLLTDSLGKPDAIVEKNKGTRGQVRFIRSKIEAKIQEIAKGKKPNFEGYMEILNALGFSMTNINYTENDKKILIESAEQILAQLSKSKKKDLYVNEFFSKMERKRLMALASLEAARNGEATDMQHIRADGKSIYGMIEHNMISQVAEFINNMAPGTSIESFFAAFPQYNNEYTRNSHMFTKVLFDASEARAMGLRDVPPLRTGVPFKISIIEAARINKPGEQGEVNTKLDKADRLWIMLNSILRNVFPVIRTSDKALEYGIETSTGFNVTNISEQTLNILDIFRGYLRDELAVGQSEAADNVQHFEKNKKKGASPGLYFFEDILKDKVRPINPGEDINAYIAENKTKIDNAISAYLLIHDMKLQARMEETGMLEELSNAKYNIYALNLATKEELAKKSDRKMDSNNISSSELGAILRTITVNSLISNIEQTKLFFGHPAFYKNTTDLLKRTAGAVGTKTVSMVDPYINSFMQGNGFVKTRGDKKTSYDGTFEAIVMDEPKGIARGLKQLRKMLVDTYGKEIGENYAKSYEEYEEADGQGYITLPEYRELLFRNGEWSDAHEELYQKLMAVDENGDPVKLSEKDYKNIGVFFNPLKTMYYGFNKMDNVAVPTYFKFSLMPLIPSVYKGSQIEGLAESLMDRAIGVMVYPSVAKVGALKNDEGDFTPLYDEETGEMTELSPDGEMPTMNLDYRFMGIQVSTGYEMKNKATVGTQHRKIAIGNLFEGGAPIAITLTDSNGKKTTSTKNTERIVKEYHEHIRQMTSLLGKRILAEIGAEEIAPGKYKIKDYGKLAKKLKQTAYDRNQVDNIINSFATLKDADGVVRFKYILDAVPGRNKIENLLFALINNTVISQKFVGAGKIQASATGFEKTTREYKKEKLVSNPALRFYATGKNGETLPMQVRLVADANLQKIIDRNGGREEVNRKLSELWALEYDAEGNVTGGTRYDAAKVAALGLDPEIFQIVGFRIPTDSRATTESMEIAEFLDPAAGEAIHVPSELVAKSGGDFDIDKLTVYFNSLDAQGNMIDNNSIEGLQNKINKLVRELYSAPELMSDLLAPVSAAKLKELADIIEPSKTVSSTESLTLLYHLDQGEYYLVGKAGVGIIARHGTHHTLAQQSGLKVKKSYKNYKGDTVSTKMNFEGLQDDYSLSKIWDSRGPGKGFKISQVISQFLQAFVDVAKDPFIFRMNGSTRTADIYAYLVRRGVPIETVAFFMNQPVIREFYSRLAGANALFKQGKRNSEGEKLVDTLSDIERQVTEMLTSMAVKAGLTLSETSDTLLTEDMLKRNVGKTLADVSTIDNSFIRTQHQVLKDFKRYIDQANQLRELMDMTSDDTVRPKNFNALDTFKSKETPAMFEQEDVDAIYNSTFLGAFKEAHGLSESFREIFITEMNTIRSQFSLLRSYLIENGVQGDDLNKIMDKAKNDFMVYAFMHHPNITKKIVLDLFKGEGSFPKTMLAQIKNKKLSQENPFIRNLYALLENPQSLVDNLKMFNVKLTVHEHNEIVAGIKALKSTRKGDTMVAGAAVFALVQSGLDNSPITWYDKIPVDVMHNFLKPGIEAIRGMTSSPSFELQQFFHQFIRNNYMNAELVPTLGRFDPAQPEGNWNFKPDTQGKIIVATPKYSKRMYLKLNAKYVFETPEAMEQAKNAGIPVGEYLLLMKVGPETFQVVNKQGSGMYMKEYARNVVSSSLNENNPNEGAYASMFINWKEPVLAPFQGKDTKQSIESLLGKETKKKCKTK
jgi:hypothetical protein